MPNEFDLLNKDATCAFFGGNKPLNYATLYRGIKKGRFPKPIRIGANSSRWLRSECEAALQAMMAERPRNKQEAEEILAAAQP